MFTYFGSDSFRVHSFTKDKKLDEVFKLPHDSIASVSVAAQGNVIGVLDNEKVTIYNVESKSTFEIPVKDQSRIVISPCGRVLFTYKAYKSISGELQGHPNVHAFSVADGKLLKSYIHRANEGWRPQWTSDSTLCLVRVDGELHLYLDNRFEEKPADRLIVKGVRQFVLSTSPKRPHIALYIPGEKGYPSTVRLYAWRDEKCHLVTSKSFYRADSARSLWNDRGTDLLVLTSTRTSQESYYGEQCLYYLTTHDSGDNALVPMPRKGSIYDIAWRPTGGADRQTVPRSEEAFVVCYGDPPASITVFGLNCEPRFNFGTAYCNQLLFNPQGNLLLLAGLGNMPGDMSVWDFGQREQLSAFKTNDISTVAWMNDGEHLLMATVTPRLRVNNGFGVWHYGGGQPLFFQRTPSRAIPKPATMGMPASTEHELYEVQVVPVAVLPPAPKPKKFALAAGDGSGAKPAAKYVPPALRNRSEIAKQSAFAMGLNAANPSVDGSAPNGAKSTTKPKKRKKPKSSTAGDAPSDSQPKLTSGGPGEPECSVATGGAVTEEETKKLITRVRQKLNQIEKLKAQQAAGKPLDSNQTEKVASETHLRAELARLSLAHWPPKD